MEESCDEHHCQKELETDEHPMSENMYNNLSLVRGFTEMNGSTYEEYCAKWRERSREATAPHISI
jgi:hypothetical protein